MFHVTADFVYVRLHGDLEIYTSGYSSRALANWARRIRGWDEEGRDVYVYFDNDVKVRAPYDAQALMRKLGLDWPAHERAVRLPAVAPQVLRSPRSLGPRARATSDDPRWNFSRPAAATRRPSRTRTGGTPARR
jgi:hypothetical protein